MRRSNREETSKNAEVSFSKPDGFLVHPKGWQELDDLALYDEFADVCRLFIYTGNRLALAYDANMGKNEIILLASMGDAGVWERLNKRDKNGRWTQFISLIPLWRNAGKYFKKLVEESLPDLTDEAFAKLEAKAEKAISKAKPSEQAALKDKFATDTGFLDHLLESTISLPARMGSKKPPEIGLFAAVIGSYESEGRELYELPGKLNGDGTTSQPLRCNYEEFDADLSCIGAPNGVIQLEAGKKPVLLQGDEARAKKVTYRIPDPYKKNAKLTYDAECALSLTGIPDKPTREYFLKELALAFLGDPMDRFFSLTGQPSSGKSKFCEILKESFGSDYVSACGLSTFTEPKDAHSATSGMNAIAPPVRIAVLPEKASRHFDHTKHSEQLRALSSGDTVRARNLWENERDVKPSATLIFCSNETPNFGEGGKGPEHEAVQRRLRSIEMGSIPEEKREYELAKRFKGEGKKAVANRQAVVAHVLQRLESIEPGKPLKVPKAIQNSLQRSIAKSTEFVTKLLQEHMELKKGGKLTTKEVKARLERLADGSQEFSDNLITRRMADAFNDRSVTHNSHNDRHRDSKGTYYLGVAWK